MKGLLTALVTLSGVCLLSAIALAEEDNIPTLEYVQNQESALTDATELMTTPASVDLIQLREADESTFNDVVETIQLPLSSERLVTPVPERATSNNEPGPAQNNRVIFLFQ